MNTNEETFEATSFQGSPRALSRAFGRVLAKTIAWAWRLSSDRQAVASLLGRYSAHLGIIFLVLLLVFVGRITWTQISVAEDSAPSSQVAAEPMATPTLMTVGAVRSWQSPAQRAISRQVIPHTTIPDRVRLEVITYTVQMGDTIYDIAWKFDLSPETIVWSNMEPLQGAPWLINPGLVLAIPPIDGAYHTVAAGESVRSIAEQYEVEPVALYNMWNGIDRGQTLSEGQLLVVPGGVGETIQWEAPPPDPVLPMARSSSFSGSVTAAMTGADGWWGLPTGSYAISGWTFHDPRNPRHIGLDYRCSLGDAIYAADNGIVTFTGWSGGYGNLVIVDHGNGYTSRYAHFDSIWVTAGDLVPQGSVLGACGTTGWSTGPHLHFEIRYGGVPQNPQLFW